MKFFKLFYILIIVFFLLPLRMLAWSEHPMILYPILRDMPAFVYAEAVEVKSLERFLMEEEQGLMKLLANHETYAREHILNYAPRPDALAFKATGNAADVLPRFFAAIRINPQVKMALYLHLLAGEDPGERELVDPYDITPLKRLYEMLHVDYIKIEEGEFVEPVYILASASDEPDYGFDIGLFEDNKSVWGRTYGFGKQSFGNPELEYGSQAPFHMGFYHESRIVFAAAPFLKKTFVTYRIHLYKTLAEYAFNAGQGYWGYRFLGWATHYLNDMSMPYHTSVLPAKRTLGMLWINIKAMLGLPRSLNNTVQLLSNRHTVYEQFQWKVLREAHLSGDKEHPFLKALVTPVDKIPYSDDFVRNVASRESNRLARKHDKRLIRNVPAYLVSDPGHSISSSSELDDLMEIILTVKGEAAIEDMTDMIAERFRSLSMHTRSFLESVTMPEKTPVIL